MRGLLLVLFGSVAHAAPCKSERAVAAVHELWGTTVEPVMVCRPIRAAHPLVLVQAHVENNALAYAAVLDPAADTELWSVQSYPGTPGETYAVALADLDGDGKDELVVHQSHTGHMGTGSETLLAYAIRDKEIVDGGSLPLAITGSGIETGQNACTATWALVGGRGNRPRVQIGTRAADPRLSPAPEACPRDGVHRYRWTGQAFTLAD